MLKFLTAHRKKLYIILQTAGWGSYTIVLAVVSSLLPYNATNPNASRLLLSIFEGAMGLLLTHLYRNLKKSDHWMTLPLPKLLIRSVSGSILIGALHYASVFAVYYGFKFYVKTPHFSLGLILAGILNYTIIILLWDTIYLAVHYFENYQRAEIERFVWEAAVKDFELKTLKSQLNPHFVFNALNGIRALIEENPERAKSAITQLSGILRYSLMIDRVETVSLEDEVKTVYDYLSLEQVRFEERLKFFIDIAPATAKIEIPPMMIQTLVENGIKHGISKIPAGGELVLKSSIENDFLVIKIVNSGTFDLEALKNAKGFGVSNTKQRLSLIYGDKARFDLFNNSEGKVESVIHLPINGERNESINS